MKKFVAWALKKRGVTHKGYGFWGYFGQGLFSGIVLPLAMIGAFYGFGVLESAGLVEGFYIFGIGGDAPAETPRGDYVSALIDSGECWSGGEAPAEPTRVIYDGKVYGGEMVGKALDAIFADAENGVKPEKVSGFCK